MTDPQGTNLQDTGLQKDQSVIDFVVEGAGPDDEECSACKESPVMGGAESGSMPWIIAVLVIIVILASYYWYTTHYAKTSAPATSPAETFLSGRF